MFTKAIALPLLLASVASSTPIAKPQAATAASVILKVGLELDGDAVTTRDVPFNTLSTAQLPPASSLSVNGASNVPIGLAEVTCQAFSDAQGLHKLGDSFNGASESGISFAQLTTIGSVFCSDPATVAAFPPASAGATVTNVRIQFNFEDEGASQGDVPVNGQVTATRGVFAGLDHAESGEIVSGTASHCDVFSDALGKEKVGTIRSSGPSSFGGEKTVRGVACFA